jgi:hypothetical protein
MSRRAIWLLIAIYLISALSFGFYEAVQDPAWALNADKIGRIAGGGFTIFTLTGVLPLIGWAFVKFRSSRAAVPMLAWLMIGVGMAYLSDVGNRLDRSLKIDKFVSDGGLVGKDKEDFLQSTKFSCEQQQRSNPLTGKMGLSDAKIVAYCDCYAAGASAAVTIEELRYAVSNGNPPASFKDKATMLGQFCGKEVLQKKS